MNKKVPISVIVPIKNEAENLPRCLKSVEWADEIYVVDSNSTDGSQEIAECHGAKVIQFKFNGLWPKKKNWALENLSFKHEWIFILDADEVLSIEAENEFRSICLSESNNIDGYFINRRFMFMGKWLKHAYYPNWNMRLFKHRLGRYEKLSRGDTQSGDNEVHEHVVLKGNGGYLKTVMDHYAFPDIETFVEKHNRYSNWEARVQVDGMLNEGSVRDLLSREIGMKRRLKIMFRSLPFRPLLRFLYVYFIQRGFLDGREGYYFARLHGYYELFSLVKIYELKKKSREVIKYPITNNLITNN